MSNTRKWRAKPRTAKPNSRQKRNGLFLDAHPTCRNCPDKPSEEAHHTLPRAHPQREDWAFMEPLCRDCHVEIHSQMGS
jgi:5-methylcytosine-specific restriction endonuclease McrA